MPNNAAPKSNNNAQIIEFPTSALSPDQHRAIEYLMLGHTLIEISMKLRIDRKTLYQWRKNPIFQAEFNRKQAEALDVSNQRLRRLAEKAVSVVEKHLDEGNLHAATALLKLVQGLPQPDKETSPHRLLKRQAEEYAIQAWNNTQPFAERDFSSMTYDNPNFRGLARDFYDGLLSRYKLDPSDSDELCDEISAREDSRSIGQQRLEKIMARGKNNENQAGGMVK